MNLVSWQTWHKHAGLTVRAHVGNRTQPLHDAETTLQSWIAEVLIAGEPAPDVATYVLSSGQGSAVIGLYPHKQGQTKVAVLTTGDLAAAMREAALLSGDIARHSHGKKGDSSPEGQRYDTNI